MRHLRAILALRTIALVVLILHVTVPAAHALIHGHVVHATASTAVDPGWHGRDLAGTPAHPIHDDGTPDHPDHPCKLCQVLSASAHVLAVTCHDLPPFQSAGLATSAPRHVAVRYDGSKAAFEARGPPAHRQA